MVIGENGKIMAKQLIELNDKYYVDFIKGGMVNRKIRDILSSGEVLELRAAGGTTFSSEFWKSAVGTLKQTWSKEELKETLEITGLSSFDQKIVDLILR